MYNIIDKNFTAFCFYLCIKFDPLQSCCVIVTEYLINALAGIKTMMMQIQITIRPFEKYQRIFLKTFSLLFFPHHERLSNPNAKLATRYIINQLYNEIANNQSECVSTLTSLYTETCVLY